MIKHDKTGVLKVTQITYIYFINNKLNGQN